MGGEDCRPAPSTGGDGAAARRCKNGLFIIKNRRNRRLKMVVDLRNEKITRKIREHSMQKLPYILVVGDKEKEAGAVAVRARGNIDLGVMPLDAFVQKISGDITHKSVN